MTKPRVALDVECYRNFFCINCEDIDTGERKIFVGLDFDRAELAQYLSARTVVTFNGTNYDFLMLALVYYRPELDEHEVWEASCALIRGHQPWGFKPMYQIPKEAMRTIDHVDLIEVAFGKAGLKLYAGRLHAKHMQDLPYEFDVELNDLMKEYVIQYCWNDVGNTIHLFRYLEKQIALRASISEQYGVDVRSKSDAQIAEHVIAQELKKMTGKEPRRPSLKKDAIYKYKPPSYLVFQTDKLRSTFQRFIDADFRTDIDGVVISPPQIALHKVSIGSSIYQVGIGGLHSTEKKVSHVSDNEYEFIDTDVESFYPNMILNNGWFPKHLGPNFLVVFRSILDRRIQAKHNGDQVVNATLKIVVNGSFGKFGSKFSAFYSPDLMLQTTVTGQLSLLMLIEELELKGFSVVSANTDGIVTKVARSRKDEYLAVIRWWEETTSLKMEATHYKWLRSRDISNYIAMTFDGKVKRKGEYRPADISKNPNMEIVSDAVVEYFKSGKDPLETIMACNDVRKFISIQQVKSGAMKDGEHIGKVIRSYKARRDYTPMKRSNGAGKVAKSDGSKPLMTLPDQLPDDIDFKSYEREAWRIIRKDFEDQAAKQMDLFA